MHVPGDNQAIGAPLLTLAVPKVTEVGTFGDMDEGDGAKVIIQSGNILFMARIDGTEMLVGFTVEHVLEMIGEHTRKSES